MSKSKTIVVIGETITALGTLRALRPLQAEGYKIWLVTTERRENIALSSNVPDRKIIFRTKLVEGLLNIGGLFKDPPLLLFTSDTAVVEVSRRRAELSDFFRFYLPDHATVELLMEKGRFTQFALERNLPIPRTLFVRNEKELRGIHKTIPYPIIVKPYLLHAVRLNNEADLDALAARLEPVHYQSMIAQHFIEGADDQLYFCFMLFDENRRLVRSLMGRKLRQWPVSYGTTSLAVTVDNPALFEEARRFAAELKMVGYCSIEYKYDAATDSYYIMEPTIGRFNQQIALTIAGGVNLPLAMVRMYEGKNVEPVPQRNGIRWVYESNDLFSYTRGANGYGYLGNFLRPGVPVLFNLRDPRPLWFEIQNLARKKMRKIFRHV